MAPSRTPGGIGLDRAKQTRRMKSSTTRGPRVIVITGASSGIGRALAPRLAAQGDRLVLSSRSSGPLSDTAEECLAAGGAPADVLELVTDVRNGDAVDGLIATTVERFGRVDVVVHCAGALAYGRFTELPAEVFDGTLDTVLGGTARVARSALRQFEQQSFGHLVVVGSVLGKVVAPTMSAYVTAKWAVHGLVRCLQVELRDSPGVHVSLLSPGGVDTPIYAQAGTYTGHRGSPPPPVASADRIAKAIVEALDKPERDRIIGLFSKAMVLGFRVAPRVFDMLVGPLFGRLAQSRRSDVPAGPGNVLEPLPEGEAISGGYGRWGTGTD